MYCIYVFTLIRCTKEEPVKGRRKLVSCFDALLQLRIKTDD